MRTDVLKIFIGYDEVESVAWHTMAHSILARSSRPVALIPVNIRNFSGFFSRDRNEHQSNEFSFSRFLVPYLCGYEGFGIYFDCDMLVTGDIADIFDPVFADPGKAVYVVKHDYSPKNSIKYLGRKQHSYPRKNWSSVVVWDCGHPSNREVTPEFVETASGMQLHRFLWLKDEEIGSLELEWNWLVGEYKKPKKVPKNIHWTIGGPYFEEYSDADFADIWFDEKEQMINCYQLGGKR